MDSYVPPTTDEFKVNNALITLIFEQDLEEYAREEIDRFNLEGHDERVEERYSSIGHKANHK